MKWILAIIVVLAIADEFDIHNSKMEDMQEQIASQHKQIIELEIRIYNLENR